MPVKVEGHAHVYEPAPSLLHTPPFKQGLSLHASKPAEREPLQTTSK